MDKVTVVPKILFVRGELICELLFSEHLVASLYTPGANFVYLVFHTGFDTCLLLLSCNTLNGGFKTERTLQNRRAVEITTGYPRI
jgi:hypothetical protein